MTNFEKYKDEILDIARKNKNMAVINGKPMPCNDTGCENCDLYNLNCISATIEWLYDEAKTTLTAKERAFCEIVTEGYIARDEDGELYAYANQPPKGEVQWDSDADYILLDNEYFPFITWEDEEPWSIKELLKLEVEDDKD